MRDVELVELIVGAGQTVGVLRRLFKEGRWQGRGRVKQEE